MTGTSHLTTGQIAAALGRPAWLIRRAVDALGLGGLRVGPYRAVPAEHLPRVREQLERMGYPAAEEAAHAR